MTAKASSTAVFGLYVVLSIVLTWPVILGIGSDVPGDLGDSLLNMWILGWGVEHVPMLLTGSISWTAFWNANIFHPDPLALALSEHLFGQTLQILPVYWLTGNIILCYNLLFISTFALSAFGTYLLVRDLTGDKRAAFIAGLVYGFLPYRIASVPHVQVMSSQWMPFALYGINRFIATGSVRALAGGTAALVMQNWSCGYYLLYFTPFVPLFAVHRMWTGGTLRSIRAWAYLTGAGAIALLLALPFLFPYQAVQRQFGIERSFGEVVLYSANVWSYITASENLTFWGDALRFYPHGEGETFLGFVPWLLACVAMASLVRTAFQKDGLPASVPRWRTYLTAVLLLAVATQLIAVVSVFLFGGFDLRVLGITISARTPQRLVIAVRGVAGVAADRLRARPDGGLAASSLADLLRLRIDRDRDLAIARPDPEGGRVTGLRSWPLPAPLRLRAWVQRRARAGSLRDDRWTVPGRPQWLRRPRSSPGPQALRPSSSPDRCARLSDPG